MKKPLNPQENGQRKIERSDLLLRKTKRYIKSKIIKSKLQNIKLYN